jgi:hypothetical protein
MLRIAFMNLMNINFIVIKHCRIYRIARRRPIASSHPGEHWYQTSVKTLVVIDELEA